MARIICFADNAAVVHAVQQGFVEGEHSICLLSASRLTSELRRTVQNFAPDLILLELSHATDNPHLYFFLRADQTTRNTPIILVSSGKRLAQQAEMLGADGYVERPFLSEQLRTVLKPHLQMRHAVAA
jgi:two-component SAPR family response regulator